jgi:CubicO group peptidase (beta-lactamase class C family)
MRFLSRCALAPTRWCLGCVCVIAGLTAAAGGQAAAQAPAADASAFPGASWDAAAAGGWSVPRLEVLRAFLKTTATTALMVLDDGRVVFDYGDLARVSKVASVRKSVLALLYGKGVETGQIDLARTVKQLGLDDVHPFMPVEEAATLEQLLAARSGVYLPAGNEELTVLSPRRGSQSPGT